MGIVKRIKCEKKLHAFADTSFEYETSDDSGSGSGSGSGLDNSATKRKTKHRWFHFFKPNKPDEIDCGEDVKNYRSSMALVSANHFAEFLDQSEPRVLPMCA